MCERALRCDPLKVIGDSAGFVGADRDRQVTRLFSIAKEEHVRPRDHLDAHPVNYRAS
jgi:hypothetical protein